MKLAQLQRRHQRLKRSLLNLGPTLQGSILRRVIQRQDPEHPQRTKDYGPYCQWTRKVRYLDPDGVLTGFFGNGFGTFLKT